MTGSEEISTVCKALSDPTRAAIVAVLVRAGSMDVTTLQRRIRRTQPTTSHHLGILRSHGLVTAQQAGRRRIYSLVPKPLRAVGGLLLSA